MSDTNTYTWTISAMEAYTTQSIYNDVVYIIHWRYGAVDQSTSHSAEVYGMQTVAPYNPDSGSFIPYSELTKPIVVGWLTSSMGEARVNELTASLDSQIEAQINPVKLTLAPPFGS
jgi:hypothetical protein